MPSCAIKLPSGAGFPASQIASTNRQIIWRKMMFHWNLQPI
ncbi:MAG: hypothetical protein ACTS6P_02150 [Candidatus Hodgkinia cicadicola]